jgi:hypothetical protein
LEHYGQQNQPETKPDDKSALKGIMSALNAYVNGKLPIADMVKTLMLDVTSADERGLAFNCISLRALVYYALQCNANIVETRKALIALLTACYIKQGKSSEWARERAKKCIAPRVKKALGMAEFQAIQRNKLGLSD